MRCEKGNFTVGLCLMANGLYPGTRMGELGVADAFRDREDAARDNELMRCGYRVIRFRNNQLTHNLVAWSWSSSSAIRLLPSQIRACSFPAPGSSRG
jgi:Protein of unknown function (DUF559)